MQIGVALGGEGGEHGDVLPSERNVLDGDRALLTIVNFVNDDEVDPFAFD